MDHNLNNQGINTILTEVILFSGRFSVIYNMYIYLSTYIGADCFKCQIQANLPMPSPVLKGHIFLVLS